MVRRDSHQGADLRAQEERDPDGKRAQRAQEERDPDGKRAQRAQEERALLTFARTPYIYPLLEFVFI
jgi:hypothetical protein